MVNYTQARRCPTSFPGKDRSNCSLLNPRGNLIGHLENIPIPVGRA